MGIRDCLKCSCCKANEGDDENGPYNDAYRQQKLKPVCTPILNSRTILFVLIPSFIFFVAVGIILLTASDGVVEQRIRYDNKSGCAVTSSMSAPEVPKICRFSVTLDEEFELPLYFYYELTEFYQNHRTFLNSYSYKQLQDGDTTSTDPGSGNGCSPLEKYNEKPIYPCGLIANSFFSDRFTMYVDNTNICPKCDTSIASSEWKTKWDQWENDEQGYWKRENIAWKVDQDDRFVGTIPGDNVSRQGYLQVQQDLYLPNVDDPDFIVWMRIAALPTFRKLHRVIEKLPNGKTKFGKGEVIEIEIANWFSVEGFDGEKAIILSNLSWAGSKCHSLAYAYITIGIIALLIAICVAAKKPTRKLGKFEDFNWETNLPMN